MSVSVLAGCLQMSRECELDALETSHILVKEELITLTQVRYTYMYYTCEYSTHTVFKFKLYDKFTQCLGVSLRAVITTVLLLGHGDCIRYLSTLVTVDPTS